jgi:hypothetical protein
MLVSPVRWGNALATPLAKMNEGEVWKRLLGHALRVFAEFGFLDLPPRNSTVLSWSSLVM